MSWTRGILKQLARDRLADYNLIVVSNREPYIHSHVNEHIECFQPASGMAAALDPVMEACGGVWVAHGSGNADREVTDSNSRILVPPGDPRYTLAAERFAESGHLVAAQCSAQKELAFVAGLYMRKLRERSGSDDVPPLIQPIYPADSEGPALRYARKTVCRISCLIEIHCLAPRSLEMAASHAQARITTFKSDRSPVARSSRCWQSGVGGRSAKWRQEAHRAREEQSFDSAHQPS